MFCKLHYEVMPRLLALDSLEFLKLFFREGFVYGSQHFTSQKKEERNFYIKLLISI